MSHYNNRHDDERHERAVEADQTLKLQPHQEASVRALEKMAFNANLPLHAPASTPLYDPAQAAAITKATREHIQDMSGLEAMRVGYGALSLDVGYAQALVEDDPDHSTLWRQAGQDPNALILTPQGEAVKLPPARPSDSIQSQGRGLRKPPREFLGTAGPNPFSGSGNHSRKQMFEDVVDPAREAARDPSDTSWPVTLTEQEVLQGVDLSVLIGSVGNLQPQTPEELIKFEAETRQMLESQRQLQELLRARLNPTGEPTVREVMDFARDGTVPARFADLGPEPTQRNQAEVLDEMVRRASVPPAGSAVLQGRHMPEISGDVLVYTDERIYVRNTPGVGWSVDWDWQGQRAWVPFQRLPRHALELIAVHLKDREHFPQAAAAFAFAVLQFPARAPQAPSPVVTPRADFSVILPRTRLSKRAKKSGGRRGRG